MGEGIFGYKFTRKRHDIPVLFIKREVLMRKIAAMFPLGRPGHLFKRTHPNVIGVGILIVTFRTIGLQTPIRVKSMKLLP